MAARCFSGASISPGCAWPRGLGFLAQGLLFVEKKNFQTCLARESAYQAPKVGILSGKTAAAHVSTA